MKKFIWTALAAAFALTSCTYETEIMPDVPASSRTVVFSQVAAGDADTRAMDDHPIENRPYDGTNKGMIPVGKSFGVYAWKHNGATVSNFTAFQNKAVTRDGTDTEPTYSYGTPEPWPGASGDRLSFLAYYPHTGSGDATANGGLPVPTFALDGDDVPTMTLDYTVPASGAKHIDLMYAAKVPTAYADPGTVPLTFRHALARMTFSARIQDFKGDPEVKVTGIVLKNAKRRGTLTVSGDKDSSLPDTGPNAYVKPVWAMNNTSVGDIGVASGHILDLALNDERQRVIKTTEKQSATQLVDSVSGDLIIIPQPLTGLTLRISVTVAGKPLEYDIPLTALPALEMNMIYDFGVTLTPQRAEVQVYVVPWDGTFDEDYLFSGQYFLKVGKPKVFESWEWHDTGAHAPNLRKELTIETDYDGTLPGYGTPGWTIDPASLSAPWMSVTKTGATTATITVGTNHGPATLRTATFDIVAGNLRKKITIQQKPGGILASPGVIGIGMETGNSTLKGSREYSANTNIANNSEFGALADETVYVAYFKWGSLLGLSSANNGAFTSGDIVWWPQQYDNNIAGQDAYEQIPFAKNVPFPDNTPENAAAGLGDPCLYADGAQFDEWKMPTGGIDNGGWNRGTFGAPGTNTDTPMTLPTGTAFLAATSGLPAGAQAANGAMFLPQAGLRVGGGTLYPPRVAYWSSAVEEGFFSLSGNDGIYFLNMYDNNGINVFPAAIINSEPPVAQAVRCVKEPTLEISEDEFVFEAVPGSSQTLQVRTDYQQGWKATVRDSENSTSVSTTSWLKIADADEAARYTLSGPGGETFHDITLTAEVYNNTVTHREAWIHITAGSTTLKVRVTQDSLVVSPRYAPPGVIGVIEGTNTLTLKGSKEYAISPNDKEYADDYLGGLENKTVYVVYFKFGSLVAISSDPTDNASPYLESDDIIEWPVEYTDTAWISAPDWEDIPSYTPEDYDYPNKRNVSHVDYHNPENFALGKGDPCMYYFGSKHGGGWHLPSDIVRVPTWMTGWYAADGVEVDFPAPGRRKSLRFYPAAGDRTGTGRVMRQGTSGRYWSPTTRDDDDSEVLYFSEEHVRPEGGGANTRMFSQHTVGHIVRCAR